MALQKNKPILFSIDHDQKAVEAGIDLFKKTLKGKKTLFIELTEELVAEGLKGKSNHSILTAAYQRLVAEAAKAGLKIVALDNKKNIDELARAEIDAMITSGKPEQDLRRKEFVYYLCYNKRERNWIRKLKNARSTAIVVMHPGHASEIAKKLRIPKQNIIGKLKDASRTREHAKKEAVRRIGKKAAEMREKAKNAGQPTGYARKALLRRRTGK